MRQIMVKGSLFGSMLPLGVHALPTLPPSTQTVTHQAPRLAESLGERYEHSCVEDQQQSGVRRTLSGPVNIMHISKRSGIIGRTDFFIFHVEQDSDDGEPVKYIT